MSVKVLAREWSAHAEGRLAAVLSASGHSLTENEISFFKEANPFGFILFGRNCDTPDQVRALSQELKNTVGWDCPILIDQEGGRVQRLKPPRWREHPPMKDFGDMAANDLQIALSDLRFTIIQLAGELSYAGVNVNCAPVLDLLYPDTHQAIGDRAFSDNIDIVFRLALSVCRNLYAKGVIPVIKHIPGQGRANLDSHKDLPIVDTARDVLESSDFDVFRRLAQSDIGPAVWGMTGHVIYSDVDAVHPASVSPVIIQEIIRKSIGFDGLLMSDDLNMDALSKYGDIADRAALSMRAGCDIALYCWADMKDMEQMANILPKISLKTLERLQKAEEFRTLAA